ncbi:MAG: hypothetical protein WA908_04105 [Pontixanthobacter sp.]
MSGANEPNGDKSDDGMPDPSGKVGYGSPPVCSRFSTTNQPKRRRGKSRRATKSEVAKMLAMKVPMKGLDGKTRNVSTSSAAYLKLRQKALSGDPRALDRLLSIIEAHADTTAEVKTAELLEEDQQILQDLLRRQQGLTSEQMQETADDPEAEGVVPGERPNNDTDGAEPDDAKSTPYGGENP